MLGCLFNFNVYVYVRSEQTLRERDSASTGENVQIQHEHHFQIAINERMRCEKHVQYKRIQTHEQSVMAH